MRCIWDVLDCSLFGLGRCTAIGLWYFGCIGLLCVLDIVDILDVLCIGEISYLYGGLGCNGLFWIILYVLCTGIILLWMNWM